MHIDYPTLSAFADGDLDGARAAQVSAHLRECAACREEIQFIRALGDALRALPAPSAPRSVVARIVPVDEPLPVEEIEGEEATPVPELPGEGWASRRRGWRLALAAGVAGLMAVGLVVTFGAERVMAGASTLTLERAGSGAMSLRYETLSTWAAEDGVRARIRYWIPDSLRFSQDEGRFAQVELSREAAGRFEGVADLPPGTAYAAATIEDLEGTYVDSDFGRFWEYLETDAEGRPTLDARRYQLLAAIDLNAPRAAALAREATSAFPGEALFWYWRLTFEQAEVPAASVDSLLATHAARLSALDRAARDGVPGPVAIHALVRYAGLLERTDLADYWAGELRARHPRHGATALLNLQDILPSQASTEEKLEILERDWARGGAPTTASLGLRYSYELADPVVTGRWLDRHEAGAWRQGLGWGATEARDLIEVPALRPLAERWILDRLSDERDWVGAARDLDQSRHDFALETRRNRAHLYLGLARLRLERDDLVGGLDALERSIEQSWDPQVFARAAGIHRSLGSDARADRLISLAQVDPVRPLEPHLAAGDDPAAPQALSDGQLAAARTDMRGRILAGLLDEYVNLDVGVRTGAGVETTFERAAGADGSVTLVLHTIRPDVVPDEAFALLGLNAERLASAGVRTVFVSEQPDPSPSARPGAAAPFHYDPDHEVWTAFRAWRELQYFVLDRSGRLRHRGEDLEAALRVSLVLAM